MTKPADRLRNVSNALEYGGSAIKAKHTADCAALLDECERALGGLVGDNPNALSYAPARALLAKLRGEQ